MKKVSIVLTAALSLVFSTSAFADAVSTAARTVKPKARVSAPTGSARTSTTGVGANANVRAGIGAATGSSAATTATGSILDGSAIAVNEEFGGSCNIGDGVTTLSAAGKATVSRAFALEIAGGGGCLSNFDGETAETAAFIYDGGIQVAKARGVTKMSTASTADQTAIAEGLVTGLQTRLSLDRAGSLERLTGLCEGDCNLVSAAACKALAGLN